MDRGRIARAQRLYHLLDGESRLHDVLQDDDRAARKVLVDAHHLLDLSRRRGALVAGQLHEGDLTRYGHFAHQVGRKDEGSVQHGKEQRVLALHVLGYLLCQFLHGSLSAGSL